MVNNLERILPDGHGIALTPNAAQAVVNPWNGLQFLDGALQQADARVPIAKGDDKFDGLANKPVSAVRPVSGTRPT